MTPMAEMLSNPDLAVISGTDSGLEMVEVQATAQLMAGMPEEIARQQKAWASVDRRLAAAADIPYTPLEIEVPAERNYFRGSRPSILNLPVDRYPAVSVMADRARSDPEGETMDMQDVYRDFFWIEVITRSQAEITGDPEAMLVAEGAINARAKRSAEAVKHTILRDPTLGGVVSPVGKAPEITHSEPFKIKLVERERQGEEWVFQASRIDFTLKKYASLPDVEPVPGVLPQGYGA